MCKVSGNFRNYKLAKVIALTGRFAILSTSNALYH